MDSICSPYALDRHRPAFIEAQNEAGLKQMRHQLIHRFSLPALCGVLLAAQAFAETANPPAPAQPVEPAVLFDAKTGELLSQNRAGEPWYPASLTKLMTAYVVFKKIRAGQLRLDQEAVVSDLANAQEPSKIGVPPGKTVPIDFALQALLVYSANDMAYVLAEAASGSIAAFSDEMNAEAQKLGMTASHFVNPNGLFDPRQVTSARDMGLVAQAIIAEFPEHQRFFDQQHVKVGTRALSNRNSLIRSMPDADGMKTGFVCNSGFNLVASATRNGRRLVAVVLGTRSGWQRSKIAEGMLETGFAQTGAQPAKLGDVQNGDLKTTQIVDMTAKVCPRKQPVLYANEEKFEGWAVAVGFGDDPIKMDDHLTAKLTEARGWELAGMGGVVNMPGKSRYAAMVWGLTLRDAEDYCAAEKSAGGECRVFPPEFLTALADQEKLKQAEEKPVAQGSDTTKKPVAQPPRKAKSKVKPARRIKSFKRAKRKKV
jgi:D-alanyl-D-alanine carboxypeptidase